MASHYVRIEKVNNGYSVDVWDGFQDPSKDERYVSTNKEDALNIAKEHLG